MTTERIREIQQSTAYPESVSVQQALLQVWNECKQDRKKNETNEEVKNPKITAEEFFREKIKLSQKQTIQDITLSATYITAEQGMRWAKEYSDYVLKNE